MEGWLSVLTIPFAEDGTKGIQPFQQKPPEVVPPPAKQVQRFSWRAIHWVVLVALVEFVVIVLFLFHII